MCLFNTCTVCVALQADSANKALEANFVKLIQRLLEDPEGRGHFLKVCLLVHSNIKCAESQGFTFIFYVETFHLTERVSRKVWTRLRQSAGDGGL